MVETAPKRLTVLTEDAPSPLRRPSPCQALFPTFKAAPLCRVRRPAFAFLVLLTCCATSACSTTLGWIPESVKTRQMKNRNYIPSYGEVRHWAYDVQDAYDSRATANRYALYAGALLGAAAIATIAGLSAFDSGSPALIGIPIGTGFLASAAALYSNDQKAVLYRHGSEAVKLVIGWSTWRLANGHLPDAREAYCLERDVTGVTNRVNRHLELLDPQNVVTLLRSTKSTDQSQLQKLLDAAKGDFGDLDEEKLLEVGLKDTECPVPSSVTESTSSPPALIPGV